MLRELKWRYAFAAAIALGLTVVSPTASAVELADGTTVRVRSRWIEAGWHTGRVERDERSCWTVQLDHPTGGGYTRLALQVVDALQLGRTGAWTAINAKQALAAAPSHCLSAASD